MVTTESWDEAYNRIYAYFVRRVENRTAVEDMTAEVLETFFIDTQEVNQHTGYLYGIAKNVFNTHLRNKYREQSKPAFAVKADEYTTIHRLFLERLLSCVRKNLKEEDREIVEMCVQYDFSSVEVAQKLGIEAANVRQRLKRALDKLRTHCKDYWSKYDQDRRKDGIDYEEKTTSF